VCLISVVMFASEIAGGI